MAVKNAKIKERIELENSSRLEFIYPGHRASEKSVQDPKW